MIGKYMGYCVTGLRSKQGDAEQGDDLAISVIGK